MSVVRPKDLIEACRELVKANVPYNLWQSGDPIPMWSNSYPTGIPLISSLKQNGIMCSDLINYARMANGLPAIGGTPAYFDWMQASGASGFDPTTPGVAGALAVNPGVWRGGSGQGHISMYVDEHTIIQSTNGSGSWQGVNEGEQDYDSNIWANYWLYGLMPDVDYSDHIPAAPEPKPALGAPRWHSINKDGLWVMDGPDWSKGWYGVDARGVPVKWHRSDEA